MGRPPLPLGAWGTIKRRQLDDGRWVAHARFRDYDGVTRQVRRWGRTGAAAERELLSELTDRTAPTGDEVTPETRLSALALLYLADCERRQLADGTMRRYEGLVGNHILPGLGGLRVRECTTQRLDRFLATMAEQVGATSAQRARSVLSGMLGLATRYDALSANPVREVGGVTIAKSGPRAMTLDEVAMIRRAIDRWQRGLPIVPPPAGTVVKPKRGRPTNRDLGDIMDALLGTGVRIGEVLAIRWQDVDLEAGTVTISGTVIRERATGRMARQPAPKTQGSHRRLRLPAFVVDSLMRRHVEVEVPNVGDLVFPSVSGTVRDPGNVRKALNKILVVIGMDWVTPHTYRRTVATILDREHDVAAAAEQLGHVDEAITRRHYVEKAAEGPDVRAALDAVDVATRSSESVQ